MPLIQTRQIGARRPLLEDWSITFPPEWAEGGAEFTLRRLIERVVRAEVERFRERQAERRLTHVLSPNQISAMQEKGKIDSGGRILKQSVDEEAAIGNAWQAFEDGIYLVVIDGEKQEALDKPVYLTEDSTIVFIRLVMLAGA